MKAQLAVRGGVVITPSGEQRATVYVSDGVVAHVGADEDDSDRSIDATGLWVLPGMVDTHVHLMDPGDTSREDFPTGTRAAAARGVTTIVEHTHGHPIRELADLAPKVAHVEGRSHVDYGLAAHVWPDKIGGLHELWEAGITFFKIFTCTTHGVPGLDVVDLRRAFAAIAGFGGATLVHCEDEGLTAAAERTLREEGRDDFGVLVDWRNRDAERVAVGVAGLLAATTGVRATIAHVSEAAVVDLIQEARARGADLAAEACPQYLTLREDEVLTEGPLRKFTPPARARSDADLEIMWEHLRQGLLTHVSTDHAPSTLAQKQAGGIWDAPFGLPGLDTTMPTLIDAAVSRMIEPAQLVEVYSEYPAKRYGLWPRKGSLAPGADADMVLVDPAGSWEATNDVVLSKAGWTPYAGRSYQGRIVKTLLRGQEIAADGAPMDEYRGQFLPGPGFAPRRV